MDRTRKIGYIKNNITILSFDNKKNILTTVMHEEGRDHLREYKKRDCVAVDLDKVGQRTIDKIYDIVARRKESIAIKSKA